MKKFFILILVAVFLGSCSENYMNNSDKLLKKKICGFWQSDKRDLMFYNDLSFTERVYLYTPANPKVLLFVRKGEYYIEHSVLHLDTKSWDFTENNRIEDKSEFPDKYFIKINGLRMILNNSTELVRENVSQSGLEKMVDDVKWRIKDSDSNIHDLSCVKKEFFFILEKDYTSVVSVDSRSDIN